MPVVLATNVLSDAVHRRLSDSTKTLAASFSRISSGTRLVSPKDDAAGRAIADGLRVDVRVFNQGIRNINDSISVVNIAEGALNELTSIVQRQLELAEQAANQTLGSAQRAALNKEAQSLAQEYGRITQSTSFNSAKLLDGSFSGFLTQTGYGAESSLELSIGAVLSSSVGTATGDGTFTVGSTVFALGSDDSSRKTAAGDIDGDGNEDYVRFNFFDDGYYSGLGCSIYLGNGDGNFRSNGVFAANANAKEMALTDLNGDGRDDLIIAQSQLEVRYGQANGTFGAAQYYGGVLGHQTLALADVNGDSRVDVVSSRSGGVSIFLAKADGTLDNPIAASIAGTTPNDTAVGDVNGDGALDLVSSADRIYVQLGNGNGTFNQAISYNLVIASEVGIADLNSDGRLDVLGLSSTHAFVLTGDGAGGFSLTSSLNIGSSSKNLIVQDFNEDGAADFATASYGEDLFAVFMGNGNGTFKTRATYSTAALAVASADFNNDDILDVIVSGPKSGKILYGGGSQVPGSFELDISTVGGAKSALTTLRSVMQGVLMERGSVGTALSRLSTALSNLSSVHLNYQEAGSRITDTDVAAETAVLVRSQILQQAGAALLVQAGSAPEVALQLLRGV